MGAAILARHGTFQHRVLPLVGLQPEEMILARDWLAPQGWSCGVREQVARRLRARVAAGIWKRLILRGVRIAFGVIWSRRVLLGLGRVPGVLILILVLFLRGGGVSWEENGQKTVWNIN